MAFDLSAACLIDDDVDGVDADADVDVDVIFFTGDWLASATLLVDGFVAVAAALIATLLIPLLTVFPAAAVFT